MSQKKENDSTTSDREIVIRRTLNAPRELVFKAWTEPEHLINWWGPRGFTNTFKQTDIRPGGIWLFTMHGHGMDFPNRITFREIVKNEKLVYDHDDGEDNYPGRFSVTVTFESSGDKTELTMRSVFVSAAVRDQVVKEYGAVEGGNQTIDKLEEHLATMMSADLKK